jgi:hypothetical protein
MSRIPTFAVVAAAGFLSGALPSEASAQDGSPMCPLSGGSTAYQEPLGHMVSPPTVIATGVPMYPGGGASQAAYEALGAQHVNLWLDTPRQGWSVAFSPGPLDATTARAAILERLATRFTPDQVAYLDQHLTLLPTPYSHAELRAVASQLAGLVGGDLFSHAAIGCRLSDAVRVELAIAPEGTPEVIARVQAAIAPFGDLVRVVYGAGFPHALAGTVPIPSPGTPPAPRPVSVSAYATLPKPSRCVRGKAISVKAASSSELVSISLAAGARRASAKPGKRARLALKRRTTSVKVTVTLRDGRTATQTVTYRRCGSVKPRT